MLEQAKNPGANPGITLVTGGTGKTGRRIVDRLKAQGRSIRVGSRSGAPAFDWNDAGSWSAALEGVSSVYVSYAPDLAVPGATAIIRRFTGLAVESGVQRIVLLTGRGEPEAQACERIVQESGITWTVVRAGWFSQNFSEGAFVDMVRDGAITLPAGDVAEPFVDVDDIADVAVAALTEAGHEYEVYEVTGPRLLTFADAAEDITRAAGRVVRYQQISQDAFNQAVRASGAPGDYAWLLNYLFETVLDGRNAFLGDGVQRALGREPRDFAGFARRVAATGVWDAPAEQRAS
jgi:uncharacterized protein YbjT (DUF2867 family)